MLCWSDGSLVARLVVEGKVKLQLIQYQFHFKALSFFTRLIVRVSKLIMTETVVTMILHRRNNLNGPIELVELVQRVSKGSKRKACLTNSHFLAIIWIQYALRSESLRNQTSKYKSKSPNQWNRQNNRLKNLNCPSYNGWSFHSPFCSMYGSYAPLTFLRSVQQLVMKLGRWIRLDSFVSCQQQKRNP